MTASSTVAASVDARFDPRIARRRMTGTIFLGVCVAAIAILLIALVALLVDVVTKGVPWLDLQFLTGVPSRRAESAGILPALVGSLLIGLMVGIIAFPIGVGAAIYLEEYARDTFVTRALRTNMANLAGVPCSSGASGDERVAGVLLEVDRGADPDRERDDPDHQRDLEGADERREDARRLGSPRGPAVRKSQSSQGTPLVTTSIRRATRAIRRIAIAARHAP